MIPRESCPGATLVSGCLMRYRIDTLNGSGRHGGSSARGATPIVRGGPSAGAVGDALLAFHRFAPSRRN